MTALRAVVPRRFEIDTFEGVGYIGLMAFAMVGVRPAWLPETLALGFLETNVRTYVHLGGGEPGVYFLSLDAQSWPAVRIARAIWHLPYFHAKMTLEHRADLIDYRVKRRGTADAWLRVNYSIGDPVGAAAPGTLQHFLIERYLLHVETARGPRVGQVYHRPYPVQGATVVELEQNLIEAAGLPAPTGCPIVHYSPGVDVEIFTPR